MQYSSLVYNLLQSAAWSITPNLPVGAPGTRLAVGVPEKIPDVTFVARLVTAADGIQPQAERDRLNGFITDALVFHQLYGLGPIQVGSVEAILNHFEPLPGPIGRIRIVSHGNNAFLFFPMFAGGNWDLGLQNDFVQAMKISDEAGLRHLFRQSAVQSPLFVDVVSRIVRGLRARNSAVLAPFGIHVAGAPPAVALPYFQIVNDLYQASHGTVYTGTNTAVTTAQRTTLTAALNIIEEAVRARLVGTVIAGAPVTDVQITAFRDAVLPVAPGPGGVFVTLIDLPAGTVANVATATAATPRVENDIRSAFTGGAASSPVFGFDALTSLIGSLELFNAAVLNQGAVIQTDATIRANADLEAFALVAVDLFLLNNGVVTQNGVVLAAAEVTTLRNGLLALANIVRARIPAPFTPARLNVLRDAIANIPYRQSTILGTFGFDPVTIPELQRATASMRANFRTKLDHFRSLIQPADASTCDVRGCLVGRTPAFLVTLREFFGTAANQPVVTAPEWFQSFPRGGIQFLPTATIGAAADALIAAGIAPNITGADIGTSSVTWRGLIDFDPHFDFIVALFAAGASKRDFASLRWRVFQAPASPGGIPVMRMQASRIDTIDTLALAAGIEQFRRIFEIGAGVAPNAATRTRLDQLQPHVVRFKTLGDAIAAIPAPTATQITQFVTDLSGLVTSIAAVGLPGGAAPAAPAAGATLADLQAYVTAIGVYLDAILDTALNPFFAALQTAVGLVDSRIHYWYSVGLPLLLQSSAIPSDFRMSSFGTPANAAGNAMIGEALRSWMRIQWEGTVTQAATMNTVITNVPMGTSAQRVAAAHLSMLTEFDTAVNPATPAVVAPMPDFDARIVKRPP